MDLQKLAQARILALAQYEDGWRPEHLLSDGNFKLQKGRARGVLNVGLSLAPSDASGVLDVCPNSTPECKAFCLFTSGQSI
ncbi:hypothetical protein [Cupriavidus pinatubonensis]|uniref:hypothetical protein n=1 Tax=Cupriavidus pinatubonensis TaxID=248026 RepID=UPI00360FEA15